jgi:hypothetical protein
MNEGHRWKKKLFSEQGRVLLETSSDKRRSVARANPMALGR